MLALATARPPLKARFLMEVEMRVPEAKHGEQWLALALIGGGVLLLALRLFDWRIGDHFWPFLVIVPGVALFAISATLPGRQSRFLAPAGAVVAGTGVILLAQALTAYFQSWAYAWTLLPVFAGAALVFVGRRDADPETATAGRRLVKWGVLMFVGFAVAFEGLIFNRYLSLGAGGLALPIVLIAAGALLLFRRALSAKARAEKEGEAEAGADAKGPPAMTPP
jgi:Na+-translocating ferredoxin:NAD+ oxidoreductase RnfD subunit